MQQSSLPAHAPPESTNHPPTAIARSCTFAIACAIAYALTATAPFRAPPAPSPSSSPSPFPGPARAFAYALAATAPPRATPAPSPSPSPSTSHFSGKPPLSAGQPTKHPRLMGCTTSPLPRALPTSPSNRTIAHPFVHPDHRPPPRPYLAAWQPSFPWHPYRPPQPLPRRYFRFRLTGPPPNSPSPLLLVSGILVGARPTQGIHLPHRYRVANGMTAQVLAALRRGQA